MVYTHLPIIYSGRNGAYNLKNFATIILTEGVIKSSADILQGRNLTETLVNFTFSQSVKNVKKVFILSRSSMQCLQQCPANGSAIDCWLNDEVTNTYNKL